MSERQVSAVVFDLGGVLISPITGRIAEVAERHGVTMEELLYVLMGPREVSTPDHPWHRAERGEIPTEDLQTLVEPWERKAELVLTGDEFEVILDGRFEVYEAVIERIRLLRAKGFRTGLLTNSFKEFRAHLESRVDFSIFDVVVDSSEVGCRKPEPQIYRLTTERMGVDVAEILYLDDFAANVQAARSHGWRAVHVHTEADVLHALDHAVG